MFTRGWGMKCIQAHYSRDEGLSEFQIQLLFTTDKFSHGETWHKDYIYKRFTKIILFCQQLYFQNILPEQFVKGKDFSNLVPDSWLHSSRLEYHVRFYSVDVKWTDSNSTSSRMAIRIAMFSNAGFFLLLFACFLVRLTVAKFYHRLLKNPLAFTNWEALFHQNIINENVAFWLVSLRG